MLQIRNNSIAADPEQQHMDRRPEYDIIKQAIARVVVTNAADPEQQHTVTVWYQTDIARVVTYAADPDQQHRHLLRACRQQLTTATASIPSKHKQA